MATIVHSGLPRRLLPSGGEVIFERGFGGKVIDTAGQTYLDFILGYGSVILGHSAEEFQSCLEAYFRKGILLPGYSSWHLRLLKRLFGSKVEKYSAAFFKTGSESVTAAIRLASHLTEKKGIIRCGFIGWHDVQLGGSIRWHEQVDSPLRYEPRFTKGFRGVGVDEPVFNWVSLDLDELRSIIEAHSHRIGCFVLDTYQLQFTTSENIALAIAICREKGILVVADETKIAGRVNTLGFAEEFGWNVDFVIIGKALANGAPLSILLGSPDLMAVSEEARITGTYSQELTAVFSALATIEQMDRLGGYSLVRSLGTRIAGAFNMAARRADVQHVVEARAIFGGGMFEICFSARVIGDWQCRQDLCSTLARNGVLLLHGHASYVCLEHQSIDTAFLTKQFEIALGQWKSQQNWFADKK